MPLEKLSKECEEKNVKKSQRVIEKKIIFVHSQFIASNGLEQLFYLRFSGVEVLDDRFQIDNGGIVVTQTDRRQR